MSRPQPRARALAMHALLIGLALLVLVPFCWMIIALPNSIMPININIKNGATTANSTTAAPTRFVGPIRRFRVAVRLMVLVLAMVAVSHRG